MPDTIREQVLQAVVGLLDVVHVDRPAHLQAVHRFRFRPLDRDKLSAIAVYPVTNTEGESELDQREDVFTVAAELRAKALGAQSADAIIEELYWWTVTRLLADRTLGGLVTEIVEGDTGWQGDELTEPYAAAAVQFTVTFHRQYANPAEEA